MSVPVHEEDGAARRRRRDGMGVELEEIPLCNVCGVEISGESPSKALELGVEYVSRFDGGLSRERLERWSEVSNEMAEEQKRVVEQRNAPPKQPRLAYIPWESSMSVKKGCSRCSVSFLRPS